MSGGALICFTGVDGSGKTTLAKGLAEMLRQEGFPSRYIYARYVPLLLRPFMALAQRLFLRGSDPFVNYSDHAQKKRQATARNKGLSLLYQAIMMVDYFFQILFKVSLPLFRGRIVVCDRYIYDTVINDLAIDFHYSLERVDSLLNHWLAIVPRPCLTLMVDVPVELACARKNDIPAAAYIQERMHLYQHVAQRLDMPVLDGSQDLTELQESVYHEVLMRIGPAADRRVSHVQDHEPGPHMSSDSPLEQS